nr:DUF6402 family protein [Plastoroseomonas hellenica]
MILEDLPGLMDRMRWPVAARLMRRWFGGPAWPMPGELKEPRTRPALSRISRVHIDDQIVTMAWARRFPRVGEAMSRLDLLWASPAGRGLLRDRIDRLPMRMSESPWQFGDLGAGAVVVDDCYGALGRVTMKIAVSGMVMTQGSDRVIEVDRTGIYILDTYEFLDDQPLGHWNRDGISRSRVTAAMDLLGTSLHPDIPLSRPAGDPGTSADDGTYAVSNRSFRNWRDANGRGADFFVVSDVAITRLPTPVRITI